MRDFKEEQAAPSGGPPLDTVFCDLLSIIEGYGEVLDNASERDELQEVYDLIHNVREARRRRFDLSYRNRMRVADDLRRASRDAVSNSRWPDFGGGD